MRLSSHSTVWTGYIIWTFALIMFLKFLQKLRFSSYVAASMMNYLLIVIHCTHPPKTPGSNTGLWKCSAYTVFGVCAFLRVCVCVGFYLGSLAFSFISQVDVVPPCCHAWSSSQDSHWTFLLLKIFVDPLSLLSFSSYKPVHTEKFEHHYSLFSDNRFSWWTTSFPAKQLSPKRTLWELPTHCWYFTAYYWYGLLHCTCLQHLTTAALYIYLQIYNAIFQSSPPFLWIWVQSYHSLNSSWSFSFKPKDFFFFLPKYHEYRTLALQ